MIGTTQLQPNMLVSLLPHNPKGVGDKAEGFIQSARTCIKFLSRSVPKFIQHCRKHVGQQDLDTHDETREKSSFTPPHHIPSSGMLSSPLKDPIFLENLVCVNTNEPHGLWKNDPMSISTAKLHLLLLSRTSTSGRVCKVN